MADTLSFVELRKIDPNMPMRLDTIAKMAFPDGSIGISALFEHIRTITACFVFPDWRTQTLNASKPRPDIEAQLVR